VQASERPRASLIEPVNRTDDISRTAYPVMASAPMVSRRSPPGLATRTGCLRRSHRSRGHFSWRHQIDLKRL